MVRFWICFEVHSILKMEQKASSNRSPMRKRKKVGVKGDSKALDLNNEECHLLRWIILQEE